ncbi:MAG: hypothetical protein LH478_09990 [Chitinophagaceae bacterium]|nr:hypothetical protein [Chitinophagaceae bacterium]
MKGFLYLLLFVLVSTAFLKEYSTQPPYNNLQFSVNVSIGMQSKMLALSPVQQDDILLPASG